MTNRAASRPAAISRPREAPRGSCRAGKDGRRRSRAAKRSVAAAGRAGALRRRAPNISSRVFARGIPRRSTSSALTTSGIAKDGAYRPANIHTVARQFNRPAGELKQLMQDYGIDATAVMEKEFDMAMAQIDMELAPEGISRIELARPIFAEFMAAKRRKIDWKRIIEEDIRENAKVFGRRD